MAERPQFYATAAGADDALARARRRRRRSGAVGSGAAAALTAGVAIVFVALSPSTKDALRVDDTPVVDPAASASSDPGDPTASPTPTASPRQPAAPATSTATAGDGGGTPPPGAVPLPPSSPTARPPGSAVQPSPAARPTAAPPRGGTTMSRTVVRYSASTDCTTVGTEPGWCVRWTGPLRSRSGEPTALSMELCNLPDGRGGQVRFSDDREIDVRLYSESTAQPDWGWYDDREGTRGPTVDVADATCLHWRLDWDGRRLDGAPMRPGTYSLSYSISGYIGPVGTFTTYADNYTIDE